MSTIRLEPASIEECNEAFDSLGLKVFGVQLEDSRPLKPVLAATQVGSCLVTSFSFQQRVHFTGSPRAGFTPFAVMASGDSWYHGEESFGRDLCGFGTHRRGSTDAHWVGEMAIVYVPAQLFEHQLEQCNFERALSRLRAGDNNVDFAPGGREEFLRMHRLALSGELQEGEQLMDMLALMLNAPFRAGRPEINEQDRRVVEAMVQGCRNAANLRKPLSLTQMLALPGVDVGRTKLNSICKQHLHGLTGKEYMKRCRMACVNASLVRREFETVEEARTAHRFNGKGDFFGDYFRQFGEMPAVTLRRYQN